MRRAGDKPLSLWGRGGLLIADTGRSDFGAAQVFKCTPMPDTGKRQKQTYVRLKGPLSAKASLRQWAQHDGAGQEK